MTEEQNQDQAAAQGEAAEAQLQIQKVYTKDVSFEIPNAPQVFQEQGQAEVKLNLAQKVEELGENMEEITLTVTVTATGGTPPYSGTGSFSRSAGSYVFTVTDANGCFGETRHRALAVN